MKDAVRRTLNVLRNTQHRTLLFQTRSVSARSGPVLNFFQFPPLKQRRTAHSPSQFQHLLMSSSNSAPAKSVDVTATNVHEFLVVNTVNSNIRTITFNRPHKKNAMNKLVFNAMENAIREATTDVSINVIVITGTGDYFSAGADVKEGFNSDFRFTVPFKHLTNAFIDCNKPIVAIVNGSAIGIGVTMLGLCDAIYSSDSAYFWTPFSQLGICTEACSSYTFPRIMGYAKASDMLMFGTKINAQQAEACGLVSQVFSQEKLESEAWIRINAMAKLPAKSLIYSKELVRGEERKVMQQVNENEAEKLIDLVETRLKSGL